MTFESFFAETNFNFKVGILVKILKKILLSQIDFKIYYDNFLDVREID